MRIAIPENLDCADPAIYFGVINLSFTAHMDGREIFRFGRPEAGPAGFAGRPYQMISLPPEPNQASASSGVRWFTLRIWSGFRNIGLDGGPPILGCRSTLEKNILREDITRFMIGVIALAAGIGGFVLYLRMQRETVYIAFAFLCTIVGLYLIANRAMRLQHLLIPDPLLWYYIEHVSLYFIPTSLSYFFQKIADDSWPVRIITAAFTTMTLVFVLANYFIIPAYATFGIFMYVLLIESVGYIYVVPHSLRHGPPEVRLAVLGMVLFLLPGIMDVTWALGIFQWWPGPMAPYGFFLLLLSMGVTVWRRYIRIQDDLNVAHQALQVYAQNLESLVDQRTSELQHTLDEVSRLKEQQDGDYLLISRVLDPMTRATIAGELVRVESLVNQHKRFEFRGMAGELGGDLCMAEQITLGRETYVAWINADAMGKSVQGASGAIVMAVAFRAFLHLSADGQIPLNAREPVEWILRLAEELQRVFRPFEGRMMVSLMLGLMNETTGEMCVINAGHPPAVLLRAGVGTYILEQTIEPIGSEEDVYDQQPGESAKEHPPVAYLPESAIAHFTLQPGDILIAGSDGRDDLRRKQSDGRNLVQHNPERFLEIVQSSGGDLERIARELETSGQLIDDLSLLRLAYR